MQRVVNFFICAPLACLVISCSALGLRVVFDSDNTTVELAENQAGIEAGALYYKLLFKDDVTLVPDSRGITLAVDGSSTPVASESLYLNTQEQGSVYFMLPVNLTAGVSVKIQVAAGTFRNSSGKVNKDLSVPAITAAPNTSPPEVFYFLPNLLTPGDEFFTIILTERISIPATSKLPNGINIVVDSSSPSYSPKEVFYDEAHKGRIALEFPNDLPLTAGQMVTITIDAGLFHDSNDSSQKNEILTISDIPVAEEGTD